MQFIHIYKEHAIMEPATELNMWGLAPDMHCRTTSAGHSREVEGVESSFAPPPPPPSLFNTKEACLNSEAIEELLPRKPPR